uniref:Ig-like domain-containing protein n=1 Tax=Pelusios castaneus TaxID=367368 RepID=A0A8C8S7Z8_9SAUR
MVPGQISPSPAGSPAQDSGFSLTVPETVSVQESLCVLVPCTFTYQDDTKYYFWNSLPQLHGHWFKYPADVNWDRPVASSDPVREVLEETRGRFQLVGDVMHGNCSLKINDARRTDGGRYFFRVERGGFKYSYRLTHSHTDQDLLSVLTGTPVPSVEEGLCVLIPCTCRYPAHYDTENPQAQLHGDWYEYLAKTAEKLVVASTDPSSAFGLYWGQHLRGTPVFQGIFSRLSRLTAKTKIQISPAQRLPEMLVAGELVTVTCTAPGGRCSGSPPQITWMGPLNTTARDILNSPHVSLQSGLHPWILGRGSLAGPNPSASLPGLDMWRDKGDVETQEGDSQTLICEADSRLVATLMCIKTTETLNPSQEGVGFLELSNLSRGDAGEYQCWAKNPSGSARRALHVHVKCKAVGDCGGVGVTQLLDLFFCLLLFLSLIPRRV